jgi:lactate permease
LGNTAPVAFGALGIPMVIMAQVTGLPVNDITAMAGRILPIFSIIIPFWLMFTYVILLEKKGMSDLFDIFPAVFVSGASFALTQFILSQTLGPQLVDILSGLISIACLAIFLKFWSPKNVWAADWTKNITKEYSAGEIFYAWVPWLILIVIIIMWGTPSISKALGSVLVFKFPIEGLNGMVTKMPPVVPKPTVLKDAVYVLPLLSATGTGILLAAILSGLWLRLSASQWGESITVTFNRMKAPFIVVPSIVGIAFLYKYAGMDVQLALAFISTGVMFPFFSAMLGYLGVFLTGSDTSSNALFGNLQKVTAEQLKLNPILSTALNSCGGVMGKMISPQSIVVALAATFTDRKIAEESFGPVFRSALVHSFLLAILVALVGMMYAYVFPYLIPVAGK